MFVIRKEQYEAMKRPIVDAFVDRAMKHLRTTLPDRWAGVADDEMRSRVLKGIERAGQHDFFEQPEVLRFLEVLSFFGPEFGSSPKHRLPIKMLRDQELTADWPKGRQPIVATREFLS